MGLHSNLARLKQTKKDLETILKFTEEKYHSQREQVKKSEEWLARMKTIRNKLYKNLMGCKRELALTDRKIKSLPSQVRKYVKENPFEALEKN